MGGFLTALPGALGRGSPCSELLGAGAGLAPRVSSLLCSLGLGAAKNRERGWPLAWNSACAAECLAGAADGLTVERGGTGSGRQRTSKSPGGHVAPFTHQALS